MLLQICPRPLAGSAYGTRLVLNVVGSMLLGVRRHGFGAQPACANAGHPAHVLAGCAQSWGEGRGTIREDELGRHRGLCVAATFLVLLATATRAGIVSADFCPALQGRVEQRSVHDAEPRTQCVEQSDEFRDESLG
jgi:hypothetical protein